MANIAIGPSKRNFIIIIMPEQGPGFDGLSLKVTITANTIAQDSTIFSPADRRKLTAR
jgi:hypothetical protein